MSSARAAKRARSSRSGRHAAVSAREAKGAKSSRKNLPRPAFARERTKSTSGGITPVIIVAVFVVVVGGSAAVVLEAAATRCLTSGCCIRTMRQGGLHEVFRCGVCVVAVKFCRRAVGVFEKKEDEKQYVTHSFSNLTLTRSRSFIIRYHCNLSAKLAGVTRAAGLACLA